MAGDRGVAGVRSRTAAANALTATGGASTIVDGVVVGATTPDTGTGVIGAGVIGVGADGAALAARRAARAAASAARPLVPDVWVVVVVAVA